MRKFDAVAGSALWMAISLLMAASALEPVDIGLRQGAAHIAAASCSSTCPERAA
jgi:hypothetical protein